MIPAIFIEFMNSRKQLQIKKGVYAQAYSIRKCECSHFFLLLDSLISFGIIIVIGILIFDLPFSILTGGMIVCIILCCASCMSIGFLLGSFGIILPDINFVYNLLSPCCFFYVVPIYPFICCHSPCSGLPLFCH